MSFKMNKIKYPHIPRSPFTNVMLQGLCFRGEIIIMHKFAFAFLATLTYVCYETIVCSYSWLQISFVVQPKYEVTTNLFLVYI